MLSSYNQREVERWVCSQGWAVKIGVGHVSNITNQSFLILSSLRWLLFQHAGEQEQVLHWGEPLVAEEFKAGISKASVWLLFQAAQVVFWRCSLCVLVTWSRTTGTLQVSRVGTKCRRPAGWAGCFPEEMGRVEEPDWALLHGQCCLNAASAMGSSGAGGVLRVERCFKILILIKV